MASSTPLISIVIPIYNAQAYLPQLLASLIGQSYQHIEVIGVDDGSSDGSAQVFRKLTKNDQRFRLVCHDKNLGAGVARNAGLKLAKGDYIIFVDHDDWADKDALANLSKWARKFPEADTIIGNFDCFDNATGEMITDGDHRGMNEHLQNLKKDLFYEPLTLAQIFVHNYDLNYTQAPWNKLFKTAFLLDNKIFFQEIIGSEDVRFYFVSRTKASTIVFIPEIVIHHRLNVANSLGSTAFRARTTQSVVTAYQSSLSACAKLDNYPAIELFLLMDAVYAFCDIVRFNTFTPEVYSEIITTFKSINTINYVFLKRFLSDDNLALFKQIRSA